MKQGKTSSLFNSESKKNEIFKATRLIVYYSQNNELMANKKCYAIMLQET